VTFIAIGGRYLDVDELVDAFAAHRAYATPRALRAAALRTRCRGAARLPFAFALSGGSLLCGIKRAGMAARRGALITTAHTTTPPSFFPSFAPSSTSACASSFLRAVLRRWHWRTRRLS